MCTMEEDEDGDMEVGWDEEFIWNPECPEAGHSAAVVSVAFSPDGTHFVSGSDDNLVKIVDTETGTEVSGVLGLQYVW